MLTPNSTEDLVETHPNPIITDIPATTRSPGLFTPTISNDRAEETEHITPEVPLHQELPAPAQTLKTLQETIIPTHDLVNLAERLKGESRVPRTVEPPSVPLRTGTEHAFWVTNADNNQNFQVQAILRYITDHLYFWIEDGVSYDRGNLEKLAETFEEKIYPTNREFFGSEWSPGVDGDPHLYILYTRNLGKSVAGYFSTADEYHPLAHEYSNGHEMFLLNADNVGLDEEFTFGVLAHEFQHMIHWYRDRDEETWLNEGFSELAAYLNGYNTSGFDIAYVRDPDLQLNDWPSDGSHTGPHYGAAFLFLVYFLDRFGEEATKALVAHPANGMVSVDEVLADIDTSHEKRGLDADSFFVDWVVTNYLKDDTIGDGRYVYRNYSDVPQSRATETIRFCPKVPFVRDVHQYGVDYIRINCQGDYTLRFEGSPEVGVVPEDPYSGKYMFWSNRSDESDMTLTRSFDFTNIDGPITLTYWTWYDLEEDYDYLYLEASQDGNRWQIITTPSGTADDPTGNSYGWGYNGKSGGWVQERVDLSQFTGEKVLIRFEYVTDAAVTGEGFLLDDLAIPEIGYFTDFEAGDGGWKAEGWVRIQNVLPQIFRLAVIKKGKDITVEYPSLVAENTYDIPIQIGDEAEEVVLVVTGTTRYTSQKAKYQIEIIPRE